MKHIIITDDDPGIQDAARIILERAGYRVTVFSNGYPLLANEFELPDLFILDKQLSGVDGLDICRFLKGQERTKHIPIIILSASPQVARLATQSGAEAFIEKPFRIRDLKDIVAHYTAGA